MDAAGEYIRGAEGVETQGEPRVVEEGPEAAQAFVSFRAPWGLQLEPLRAARPSRERQGLAEPPVERDRRQRVPVLPTLQ